MIKTILRATTVICASLVLAPAHAQDVWDPSTMTPPMATPVLEITARILPAVQVGPSDAGTRRYIPIVGGSFRGDGFRGEVTPGGADWQLTRVDGVTELTAIYSLRSDDGAVIIVNNHGLVVPAAGPGEQAYLMSSPRFFAPADGPYAWLNRAVFVGTVTPAPEQEAVIIRVFRVD
jgi:hypothetical protein